MAKIFRDKFMRIKPDIVHIHHLSHLTILIVDIIKDFKIPIVFTLHDYWMMCIRGQLIKEDYTLCNGPNVSNCANCNQKYFLTEGEAKKENEYCNNLLCNMNKKVDLFIAPSQFLRNIYIRYGIPEEKIIYMDYGFNKKHFIGFQKIPSKKIRFGFIGRVIPIKGISLLIDAFNKVNHNNAELNIYGSKPRSSIFLKNRFPNSVINFKGSFNNKNIAKVLSNVDVLVVPSIWYENSPLVIHEAFLAHIPVITSNLGGMAELVSHEKNGLLFNLGSLEDLARCLNLFVKYPKLIKLYSQNTYVRSIEENVSSIEKLYYKLLKNLEENILA